MCSLFARAGVSSPHLWSTTKPRNIDAHASSVHAGVRCISDDVHPRQEEISCSVTAVTAVLCCVVHSRANIRCELSSGHRSEAIAENDGTIHSPLRPHILFCARRSLSVALSTVSPTASPTASPTVACSAGEFRNATDHSCATCSIGQYSARSGASVCSGCEERFYAPNAGQTECIACPTGPSEPVSF